MANTRSKKAPSKAVKKLAAAGSTGAKATTPKRSSSARTQTSKATPAVNAKSHRRAARLLPPVQGVAVEVQGAHPVLLPSTPEAVSHVFERLEGQKFEVRSGTQTASQDRVGGADSVVLDLTHLNTITKGSARGELVVNAGVTTAALAATLREEGVVLPLPDAPERSIASVVLNETPHQLTRSLGQISDYVKAIDAVDAQGKRVVLRSTKTESAVARWSKSKPVVTDFTFVPRARGSLRRYSASFIYSDEASLRAIASRAFAFKPPPQRASLVLDAQQAAFDIPLLRLSAFTTDEGGPTAKQLVERVIKAAEKDLGAKIERLDASDEANELDVLPTEGSLLGVSQDPSIISTRLRYLSSRAALASPGRAAAEPPSDEAQPSVEEVVSEYVALVNAAFSTRADDAAQRVSARLQWTPDDRVELYGYAHSLVDAGQQAALVPSRLSLQVQRASLEVKSLKARLSLRPSPIPGFEGDYVSPADGKDYQQCASQYATSSFPDGTTAPSAITYPKHAQDIARVLAYAKQQSKRVVARSGGHHYTGKSSGGAETIVVDMAYLTELTWAGSQLTVGAGVRLTQLASTLKARGMTIPHGECPLVAIGGHAQTGGYGHLLRSFGLALDHVVAFEIVLADGTLKTVRRAPLQAPATPDEELFWGVLGGNAGSFGIVTRYTIDCILESDYPDSNVYTASIRYQKSRFSSLMRLVQSWTQEVPQGTLPEGLDLMMTVESCGRAPFHVLLVEAVDAGLGGRAERAANAVRLDAVQRTTEANIALWERVLTTRERKPLSHISDGFVRRWPATTLDGREFPYPYKKRVNSTSSPLTDAFVREFVELIDNAVMGSDGVKLVFQMEIGGGKYRTSPARPCTSIPHRDYVYCFVYDLFYKPGYEAQASALQSRMQALVDQHFSPAQEERAFWGTFGDTDISKPEVLSMYYDDINVYQRLQALKAKVDPTDLFHTSLTVKLPAPPAAPAALAPTRLPATVV